LFVLTTGIAWQRLPQDLGYGSGMTCWRHLDAIPAIRGKAGIGGRRTQATAGGSARAWFENLLSWAGGDTSDMLELEVAEGDITALDVDAIANAANDHLWMGAGVAGAIKRAGGEEIEREAVAKGPIPVGTAVATGAGRLKARHVVHGAVMGQDLRTSAELIERTTRACLELGDELGCGSLALPAFGTGVGGFPLDDCARLMVAVARGYEPRTLRRVVFAVFGADAAAAFREAVG
jgi:O-acetyl-ADP-ribose deacetylase (regulator of RNase III)